MEMLGGHIDRYGGGRRPCWRSGRDQAGPVEEDVLECGIQTYGKMDNMVAAYLANEELDVRSGKALRMPHGAAIAAGTLIYVAFTTFYK